MSAKGNAKTTAILQLVLALEKDILDRCALCQAWESIDDDTLEELRHEWCEIIKRWMKKLG